MALDLRAAQSRSYRERGIARYVLSLVGALVEHFPEVVGSVLVDPDRPPAPDLDRVLASGRLVTPGTWRARERIFHAMSPFDLEVPVSELWPRPASAAGMPLILTVYDLIPHLFAEIYLEHPAARAAYRTRFHLVRAADQIVTLSASAAADLVEHLGIQESRITVIGAACEGKFRPPASRERAAELAAGLVEGLEPGYVVYNGGVEPRKNMEGLIKAYAALPGELRDRRQLVLVCRMDWPARQHYHHLARALGIEGRLVLTGFIPDDPLILLYQGADLVAHPALYEGFGLPVIEAMACGAPVIASGTSSLPELVAPEACFDPRDTASITDLLARGLTDAALRARLLEWSARPRPDWSEVARRAAEVYGSCASSSRPRARARRPRLAVMPTAADDAELVRALADHAVVDVLHDGAAPLADPPRGGAFVAAEALDRAEALRGGYDAVVVTVGNDVSAASAVRFLRRRRPAPPIVIAREVQLTGLYEGAARTGAAPEGFIAAARAMYPWLSADQLSGGPSPRAAAERLGLLMAREAIACSGLFLVGSPRDAALALTDAAPEHAGRIGVLPATDAKLRAEQLLERALSR